MGIFRKPGEKPDPSKKTIRLGERKAGRWKNDEERWQFIAIAHLLFHDMKAPLETIAGACKATIGEVQGALKCERPTWKYGQGGDADDLE